MSMHVIAFTGAGFFMPIPGASTNSWAHAIASGLSRRASGSGRCNIGCAMVWWGARAEAHRERSARIAQGMRITGFGHCLRPAGADLGEDDLERRECSMNAKLFVILGSLNLFIGVALGAFGAHGLRARVPVEMLEIWHTAVEYQLVHALGLLALGLVLTHLVGAIGIAATAGWLMLAGIIIFSGSLYVLVLTGARWLGAVTPFGGVLFLLAWLLLAWGVWKGWR